MTKDVLLLGDPDSIHTNKWVDGWKLINYDTVVSGISSHPNNRDYILYGSISTGGGNGLSYIKKIFKFKKILGIINPSIINAHFLTSYGLISALIKRKKDTLIIFLPGTDVMKTMDRNFIYLMMARYTFSKSDILVSVSDVMTKKILKYFPYLKDKIITQQYGVNIEILNSLHSDDKNILLTTSRQWKPNSNYPVILEALERFSDQEMKIIGNDNSEYAKKILVDFDKLNKYSTGIIEYKKNLEYVGKSKIFVSLTSSDGVPLSLIEAIYLGAIPIVSDIEPNRELIQDGVNGFLVPIKAKALESKINDVIQLDNMKIKAIQEYNKKLVIEKFDFEKNFYKLKNKIEKLKGS